MSRPKEKYQPKPKEEGKVEPPTPLEQEVDNGKFRYGSKPVLFRGYAYPAHFELTVSDDDELVEGQVIGTSRLGPVLYWLQSMIVAMG